MTVHENIQSKKGKRKDNKNVKKSVIVHLKSLEKKKKCYKEKSKKQLPNHSWWWES